MTRANPLGLAIASFAASRSLRYLAKALALERALSPEQTSRTPSTGHLDAVSPYKEILDQGAYDAKVADKNIENYVGVCRVPLGVAGPLLIQSDHCSVSDPVWVPLATTEGALVASYNRGMRVIRHSGGVRARVWADAMNRAPIFVCANVDECARLLSWIKDHHKAMANVGASTSGHVRLDRVEYFPLGKRLHVRLSFNTGEAAGQNAASRAAYTVVKYIRDQYEGTFEHVFLDANVTTDKKASDLNRISPRGKSVTAELNVPRSVIVDDLGTTP
jgi:hydroxymethylglutaryl-CoA reductase (NADPH)